MRSIYYLKFLVVFGVTIFLYPICIMGDERKSAEKQGEKKISRSTIANWEKQIERFDLSVADHFGLPICPVANGKTGFIWGDYYVSQATLGVSLSKRETREEVMGTGALFWNEETVKWRGRGGWILLEDQSGQCPNTWRVPADWEVAVELNNPAYRGAFLLITGRYKGFRILDCKKIPGSETENRATYSRNIVSGEIKDAADEGISAWRDKTRIIDKELGEAKDHLSSIKSSAFRIKTFVGANQSSIDTDMKAKVAEARSKLNLLEADIKNFEQNIKSGEAAIKAVEDIFREARRLSILGGQYKDYEVPRSKPLDQANSVVLAMISQSWADVHAADKDLIPAVKRFKEMLKNVDAVGKELAQKFQN